MTILPRFVLQRDAPGYLGMDRTRFDAEVRPQLTEIPLGDRSIASLALNTGARDENVCGLRWDWEVPVPEAERSVFVVPATEFKGKRDHVLISTTSPGVSSKSRVGSTRTSFSRIGGSA